MNKFFYKNWGLFYVLLFCLIGWLIYSLLWKPYIYVDDQRINRLEHELQECQETQVREGETVVSCNEEVQSGGQGRTETRHELGNTSGRVVIDYDMRTIPDQMDVYYNGKLITSTTDLVSNIGSLSFDYIAANNNPQYCVVIMSAPDEDTAWGYIVRCPR